MSHGSEYFMPAYSAAERNACDTGHQLNGVGCLFSASVDDAVTDAAVSEERRNIRDLDGRRLSVSLSVTTGTAARKSNEHITVIFQRLLAPPSLTLKYIIYEFRRNYLCMATRADAI